MNEFTTSLLFISAEFGAVIIVLAVILFFLFIKKRKKDKQISEQFIEDFKGSVSERRSHIESQINGEFENKEELLKAIEAIMEKEKNIYSKVMRIFNGKDKGLILEFRNDLQALTDAFGIHVSADEKEEVVTVDPELEKRMGKLEKKNAVLKTENDRLKDDLKNALETIDSIQAEYEQLYNKTKDLENK